MDVLQFTPLLKRLRWGGRRLGSVLHKPIGDEGDYAESWELCDRGHEQTIVSSGPLRGWTLNRLVREHGSDLLGRHDGIVRFPLLLKYLDANDRLSVQVHPNDAQAAAHVAGELGKTEAWVILDAAEGSVVYAGLKRGVTKVDLAAAIARGTVEECLHRVPICAGDCLFIPAGTVHALGEGILLAEVQQSSDLTYRLFDWNRLGSDGKPRPLHIDKGLACIDFTAGPVETVVPRVLAPDRNHLIEELVRCPYFRLVRHTLRSPFELVRDDRCHILMVVDGRVRINGPGDGIAAGPGATLLIPARGGPQLITPEPEVVFLQVFQD